MKKRKLNPDFGKFKLILFLSMIVYVTFSCENTIEEIEALPSFKVVTLDMLPVSVQAEVTATENGLKSILVHKDNAPFGMVIPTRVHQRNKPDGSVSYTLGLTRNAEEFYYDNLVVNRDNNGHLKTHIVRYQPEASWFYKHKTEGLNYDTYSGSITIFDETGTLLSSVTLASGIPVKEVEKSVSSKTNTADNCEVLDVEYVGGCAGEDYCWWNEVIITVECTGTGGGNPYGDDGMNDGFDNTGGGDNGADTGTGGGAGGNTGNEPGDTIDTVPVEEIVIVGPDNPINDVATFLNCFDSTQNATLTVYVNEPDPGTGDAHNGTFVGHAFVSISQGSSTSVYGFYPTSNWITPGINNSSNSVLGNDGSGNEAYSASISTVISGTQLQQIIDFSVNHNPTYHLDNYNCTDFAIDIGNLGGLNLPQADGTWPGGGGSNPGTLGVHIRNANGAIINTAGGNAPSTNKGC